MLYKSDGKSWLGEIIIMAAPYALFPLSWLCDFLPYALATASKCFLFLLVFTSCLSYYAFFPQLASLASAVTFPPLCIEQFLMEFIYYTLQNCFKLFCLPFNFPDERFAFLLSGFIFLQSLFCLMIIERIL